MVRLQVVEQIGVGPIVLLGLAPSVVVKALFSNALLFFKNKSSGIELVLVPVTGGEKRKYDQNDDDKRGHDGLLIVWGLIISCVNCATPCKNKARVNQNTDAM